MIHTEFLIVLNAVTYHIYKNQAPKTTHIFPWAPKHAWTVKTAVLLKHIWYYLYVFLCFSL